MAKGGGVTWKTPAQAAPQPPAASVPKSPVPVTLADDLVEALDPTKGEVPGESGQGPEAAAMPPLPKLVEGAPEGSGQAVSLAGPQAVE